MDPDAMMPCGQKGFTLTESVASMLIVGTLFSALGVLMQVGSKVMQKETEAFRLHADRDLVQSIFRERMTASRFVRPLFQDRRGFPHEEGESYVSAAFHDGEGRQMGWMRFAENQIQLNHEAGRVQVLPLLSREVLDMRFHFCPDSSCAAMGLSLAGSPTDTVHVLYSDTLWCLR